jgi:hypothetical protein
MLLLGKLYGAFSFNFYILYVYFGAYLCGRILDCYLEEFLRLFKEYGTV